MMRRLVADVKLGWSAPPGPLLTGALAALAFSGGLVILLGVFTALNAWLNVLIAAMTQLALAYGIAGRMVQMQAAEGGE